MSAVLSQEVLRRAGAAPPPRTLVDVLLDTAARHPSAPALDDGTTVLTYVELVADVEQRAGALARRGVRPGDRVGVRLPSGSVELYASILAVLRAGACYVPVDVDDPDERAALVLREAGVVAVLDGSPAPQGSADLPSLPSLQDDAWIIFTSGSTGTPKGVAVTHRSAAAFVDAEARLFLVDEPLGPGDRVLAGLSVAFDASCEEMWLAWRSGACLVPAPRALVRSGMDLGPWLVAQDITVVSTVPTLAALWPVEALDAVRLLIFGGEACPPELADRLAVDGREVWNTYGPTEATVVACGARLAPDAPVRIGLPLDGWDLAVVDPTGEPADEGELVIAGVGLARYLDPGKDAEKYAPLPSLDWERAYRSGDLVRLEPEGLVFLGRADDQVKLGGRRIELGEVEAALQSVPGVVAAVAAVQSTAGGSSVLVGYVVTSAPLDLADALTHLRARLPAALVPVLAEVDDLPVRTSGKVDRAALPWPLALPGGETALTATPGWVAEQWTDVLGTSPAGLDDDFFAHGGGSLAAAQLVAALRTRFPAVTVAHIYDRSRLGALADLLDEMDPPELATRPEVRPVPRRAQLAQLLLLLPLQAVAGLRWLTWTGLLLLALSALDLPVPGVPVAAVVVGALLLLTPPGRLVVAAAGCRLLTLGVTPGSHPRGGSVHLRLWAAEQLVDVTGVTSLVCAPWTASLARLLGVRVGRDVDLHAPPPVTGLLDLGDGACVEPEVDLSGHWVDGDVVQVGRVTVRDGARVGTRSTLLPGAVVGADGVLVAGSALSGRSARGQTWAGSPAAKVGRDRHPWPAHRPPRAPVWPVAYAVTAVVLGGLPLLALLAGGLSVLPWLRGADDAGQVATRALLAVPLVAVVAAAVLAPAVLLLVRLLSLGLRAGDWPVRSRTGWQAWATLRAGRLTVRLVRPATAGQVLEVEVRYSGAPRPRRGPWGEVGFEELTDGVLVAGQPDGAPTWFPCNDRLAHKATFRTTVRVDSAYTVVASGEQVARTRTGSRTTWVYELSEPTPPYLATLQIGRYEEHELAGGPVPQRLFAPPGLRARALADTARSPEMLALFSELFGPYPFSGYTVVVTQDDLEIPLEAQAMSVLGANHVDGAGGSERLVAHELAHQWFGNSVTAAGWKDLWLHEGFACYAEWLWSEGSGGASADELARTHRRRLASLPQDLLLADPGPDLMFDDRVYKRGALALHALRRQVGDDGFFGLLRSWATEHRHGSVTTDDLLDHVTAQAGAPAAALLRRWVHERALPRLDR